MVTVMAGQLLVHKWGMAPETKISENLVCYKCEKRCYQGKIVQAIALKQEG